MANARKLIEGVDDPSDFDVKGHFDSPVARLAVTNGFVLQKARSNEERYVKKLSNGGEAWLTTISSREFEIPMDMRTGIGGREWELLTIKPGFICDYCNNERPAKGICPHCKKKTAKAKPHKQYNQVARAREVPMYYLLNGVLQRLATWNPDEPRPKLESLDEPPDKEHLIRAGRSGECDQVCPHCGAYCTLNHYRLPSGTQMPMYHICQTCDVASAEGQDVAHQHVVEARNITAIMRQIVDVWAAEDWDWVVDGCADVSYALWRIAQRKGWNVQLVTGTATFKDGENVLHTWLVVDGRIFDPVGYANKYRVKTYTPDGTDPLVTVRDTFGVAMDGDEFYSPDVDQQLADLGLNEGVDDPDVFMQNLDKTPDHEMIHTSSPPPSNSRSYNCACGRWSFSGLANTPEELASFEAQAKSEFERHTHFADMTFDNRPTISKIQARNWVSARRLKQEP